MYKRTWYIQENYKEFKVVKGTHRSIGLISNEDPPTPLVNDEYMSTCYNVNVLYKQF